MRYIPCILIVCIILSGCAGAGGVLGNKENDTPGKSVDTYYKLLMWKYYDRAEVFVYPENKADYDRFVYEHKDDLNITDYKIHQIIALDNNKDVEESIVRVYVTYYKYPSVSEVSEVLSDLWVKKGDHWYIKSKFDSDMYK